MAKKKGPGGNRRWAEDKGSRCQPAGPPRRRLSKLKDEELTLDEKRSLLRFSGFGGIVDLADQLRDGTLRRNFEASEVPQSV